MASMNVPWEEDDEMKDRAKKRVQREDEEMDIGGGLKVVNIR